MLFFLKGTYQTVMMVTNNMIITRGEKKENGE